MRFPELSYTQDDFTPADPFKTISRPHSSSKAASNDFRQLLLAELFNLAHWDLNSDDSIHSMANFLRTFTNTIIRPNDGRNAPLEQAISFILLIADSKVFYAARHVIPELCLTSTPFPSTPNPWLKAVRAVAATFIPEDFMNEPETYMLNNKSVAVVMALAALKENAPPEKRREIDDVTWAFVERMTENLPPSPVSLGSF